MGSIQFDQKSVVIRNHWINGSHSSNFDGFVCRTHCGSKREKRIAFQMYFRFFNHQFGLVFIYVATVYKRFFYPNYFILHLLFRVSRWIGPCFSWPGPTIFSLLALIVPKKLYPNAATWSSSVWQISSVLGPAVAGFSINWIGVHWSMSIVLGFSLIALTALTQITTKPILNPKIGEPIMESLKEGVKFVFNNKTILGALSLDMIAVLFGGAVALLPIFAQDILKVGPEGFGVLRAAPAVGAFLMLIISAYIPFTKNAGMKLLSAIFAFGICIIVFGVSSIFWLSVAALFLSGVFDGISVVIRQTILQLKTPDHMRGRVAAVNSIFVGSSNELGAFESGLTAKLMGTVSAVVFGGSMTLITVFLTGAISPTFRKLDLQKDIEEHEKSE